MIGSDKLETEVVMNVKDLMTREVVTISPGASLRGVAATFLAHGISGAPVCDEDGRVLGVISKRDIVQQEQGPSYSEPRSLLSRFKPTSPAGKPDARTAGEAMTQPAITVTAFTSVAGAARLMLEKGIHRLPVVTADRVCGIVAETDLVRAFARPDKDIAQEIHEELQWQLVDLSARNRPFPTVVVDGGAVVVTGEVERRSDVEIVDHLVRRVPGVESVTLNLVWTVDDLRQASMLRF
jgi:CBS domain-containing protein